MHKEKTTTGNLSRPGQVMRGHLELLRSHILLTETRYTSTRGNVHHSQQFLKCKLKQGGTDSSLTSSGQQNHPSRKDCNERSRQHFGGPSHLLKHFSFGKLRLILLRPVKILRRLLLLSVQLMDILRKHYNLYIAILPNNHNHPVAHLYLKLCS